MESSRAHGFSHRHFTGYMSDLLYIPIELLMSHQDRSVTSDAPQGHISPPSFPCSSAFRASVPSLLRRSESSFSAWRSWLFSLVWRSEPLFSVWRSKPLFRFGVQSHYSFSYLAFRATFSASAFRAILITYSVSAFRAILITSQYRCLEPSSSHLSWRSEPSLLSFGVQSHHCLIPGFGVQSRHHLPARLSEPPCLLVYDVQSRLFSAWHS